MGVELIIGLVTAATIVLGGGGLVAAGVWGRSREWTRLRRSGALLRPGSRFGPKHVDGFLMDLIAEHDRHFGLPAGSSQDALSGVVIELHPSPSPTKRHLPDRPHMAGGATLPRMDPLEAAYLPKDDLGNTALAYECLRRLRWYYGHADAAADNARGSPDRWPPAFFELIAAVDARYKGPEA